MSITEAVKLYTKGLTNPLDVWLKLQVMYNTETVARNMVIMDKWGDLKMNENSSVTAYLQQINSRGGEFTSDLFIQYCKDKGINKQLTALYTPHQYGISQCKNKTFIEKVRSMLISGNAPNYLWFKAIQTGAQLTNMSPTKANYGIMSYEKLYSSKPDLDRLRIFGCLVYTHIKGYQTKLK